MNLSMISDKDLKLILRRPNVVIILSDSLLEVHIDLVKDWTIRSRMDSIKERSHLGLNEMRVLRGSKRSELLALGAFGRNGFSVGWGRHLCSDG